MNVSTAIRPRLPDRAAPPVTSHAVSLQSVHNFRDLGGLRTSDGRLVRSGLVHRSDALTHVTEDDLAFLRDEVGVRTIVDLRASLEHDGLGRYDTAVLGIDIVELPVIDGAVMQQRSARGEVALTEMYRLIAEHGATRVRQVLELVADPAHLPVVIACSSGKDRTGVVVGVLLSALGVRRDDILADYERSVDSLVVLRERVEHRLHAHGVRPPAAAFDLDVGALVGVLDDLVPTQDALHRYLGSGGGELIDRLRSILLSPREI